MGRHQRVWFTTPAHLHNYTLPAILRLRQRSALALRNMAAVMSAKRPRALTNGIDSVGSIGYNARVC